MVFVTFVYENISDVMVKNESSLVLIPDSEVDNQILLAKPNTKALSSHVHEESIKPSTYVVSRAHLLLKYCAKI